MNKSNNLPNKPGILYEDISINIKECRLKKVNLSINSPIYILEKKQLLFLNNHIKNKKFDKILDFGAGNSRFKEFFNFEEYISSDVEQNASNNIDVIIEKGSKKLPFKTDEFNLILCFDVLEHVINASEVLNELFRILKPNGKILIFIPFLFREHEYPSDFQRYTSVGIKNILNESGFKNINIKKIGNFWLVVYLLWVGKVIKSGEKVQTSFFSKLIRKFIKIIIPLLNFTLFAIDPKNNDSIFLKMLASAEK